MRWLSFTLIALGAALLLAPIGSLIWVWIAAQRRSALHDTYYVVSNGLPAFAYLALACTSLVVGLWLRSKSKRG